MGQYMQQKMLKYAMKLPKSAITFYVMLLNYEKSPKLLCHPV